MADSELHRAISGRMLVVFIVGDILGAGIYALVGKLCGFVGGAVWLPLAIGIAAGLILVGNDVAVLASTCTFLLLLVFGIVNVAVLVLRRRPVEHEHFRAPTLAPVIGAIASVALATPLADREPKIYLLAGALLAGGALLWGVQRLFAGPVADIDPENLSK